MTKALNILVDSDGVIFDWHDGIARAFGSDTDVQYLDLSQWDLVSPHLDLYTRDRVIAKVRKAQSTPGFYNYLRPIPGSVDALRDIVAQGHNVTIVTTPDHTNPTCADDKIASFEREVGPGWGRRVLTTHDKTMIRGDILIDDKPVITGALQPAWEHVIFDQFYNRGPNTRDKARLFGWDDWAPLIETFTHPVLAKCPEAA